ncbi:hypothetical protein [Clostridium sp.]|uniref:hypothetical protein n=1 Tax=Clostridium sp. TaxID=1506 RepID=UPI00290AB5E3|nr:hypothetical protein [Clostridium sp.]MDU4848489.1 hypothetical protein [Clostridium sp.]
MDIRKIFCWKKEKSNNTLKKTLTNSDNERILESQKSPIEVWDDNIGEMFKNHKFDNLPANKKTYMELYHKMKKIMGLEDVKIEYVFNSIYGPATIIFKEVEDKYELNITVIMTCDSQIRCYIGSLAHELWHVKTSLELIKQIGIYEFAKLQKDIASEKHLAFNTISEYYSWYKAILDYNEQKCNYSLESRLYHYECGKINSIALCDTIAAHCAWNKVYNEVSDYNSLSIEEKEFIRSIMQIIMENTNKWPLTLEEFESIGKEMLKVFEFIDNKKR